MFHLLLGTGVFLADQAAKAHVEAQPDGQLPKELLDGKATLCRSHNQGLMLNLLEDMKALNLQNRKVSIIENGTWAPQAGKIMAEMVSSLKGMELVGEKVTVKSALKGEQREALLRLCGEIAESLK